jgi:nucleotide-binding universal stress UspA family protein
MFKHLLVPIDGSTLSQAALTRAVAFAKDADARITVFYAEPTPPRAYDGVGGLNSDHLTQDLRERLDEAAQDILKAAESLVREAGVPVNTQVRVGDQPYKLIIEAAQTQGCDLIFMASHGRRGVSALLLGSETQMVLTHSSIPVLVYR